jgi:membrane protein implicated in regulation of membrane protease activity
MMVVVMALPILGLGLFYLCPFQVALPVYLLFLFISGFIYYGMFTVMGKKRKVRTGFEEMTGGEAVVLKDIDPEGEVQINGELWTARVERGRFLKGEKVRICGHEGLTLIVEALTEKENCPSSQLSGRGCNSGFKR